jgi:hypothetical protein
MTMMHTILVLVVFLLGGEPQAYAATLAPGVPCDAAQAMSFANRVETFLTDRIQDEILWQCIPVRSLGPSERPQSPPHHVPRSDEA